MQNREEEYKKLFISESLEEFEEISGLLVELEKDPSNKEIMANIFRLLHNLKANAKAMGFNLISDLSHKLENILSCFRDDKLQFSGNYIKVIYAGIDYLGYLIKNAGSVKQTEEDKEIFYLLDRVEQGKEIDAKSKFLQKYQRKGVELSDLISIPVRKIDDLLNLVGELIIDRDRLLTLSKKINNEELFTIIRHLDRISSDIQQSVMDTRLINVGNLFNKFPRIVRDIADKEGKEINLQIEGQDIKIDRNILSIITDSLIHIIRNALTHGIETIEERKREGKDPVGFLSISANSDKGNISIIVEDDGKGINPEKIRERLRGSGTLTDDKIDSMKPDDLYYYLFNTGFSLSSEVTEFSGRGVGLDIVKNDLDTIDGNIKIDSKVGKGTKFILSLPTSIAVKSALLFEVNKNIFAIPLLHIDSVVTIENSDLHEIGSSLVVDVKNETFSCIYLNDFLYSEQGMPLLKRENLKRDELDVIIIEYENKKLGLIVDLLLRQQEIVVKPIQKPVHNVELFSGITLLGNGEVCFLFDVSAISRHVRKIELAPVV